MGVGSATRRALAGFGYLLLGLVALAGVALSGAYLLASTDLGRGLLVPRLLRFADDALAGSIELDHFRLLGQGGLELEGARVFDPEGDLVLSLRRGRVYLDLGRIRSRVIGLRVELDEPAVTLKQEPDGRLSIAHAFAPAHPSPAERDTGPSSWTVRLVHLALRHGAVRYVAGPDRPGYAAEGLDAEGRALVAPDRAGAELSLRGELTEPERLPLALDAAVGLRGKELHVRELKLAAGDTALEAMGLLDRATWRGRLAVLSLAVDADQVRRLAPGAPLAGDLAGSAYAESDGAVATAALDVRPRGGGAARAAAAARLPPAERAGAAALHLEGLDLARVLRGAPATSLQLDARASGRGRDLASLRGALALSLAPSRLRAGRLGPVELRAGADAGVYEVTRLDAAVPGATLSGTGRWRRGGAVAGHLAVDGRDLALLRRNLEQLLARPVAPISGALALEADLTGTEAAPSVRIAARSAAAGMGAVSVGGFQLTGSAAGPLRSPRLQLDGSADRVVAGGVDARDVRLSGRLAGRAGDVALTAAVPELGPDPLALHAAGALAPDRTVLTLTALELSWPGDRFSLESPAHVTLQGPSVDRLALSGGRQRIELEGGLVGPARRRALDAHLRVAALDLALLPRALLPPRLGLAGRLGADLAARGTPGAPDLRGRVTVDRGAILGLRELGARADLAYDGRRRRGRLELTARREAGGELELQADLPVALARARPRDPLALHLALRGFPLAEALRLARVEPEEAVAGALALEARLSGTASLPAVEVAAALDQGAYGALGGLAARFTLTGAGREARLAGTADARGARAAELEATLPVDWARLLRRPAAGARDLAAGRLAATLSVPGYDLARVAGVLGLPRDLRGRLTARVTAAGTPRAPRGDAVVDVADGALAGYRALAVHLAAAAADATRVEGKVALEGAEVLRLDASAALPLERFGDRPAREAASLSARVEVPRTDLGRAGAPVPLAGEVEGRAELVGSLAAPRLAATANGRRIQVSGHPLGDVALRAGGGGGALQAALQLAVASGGTLAATLAADADLGLPALRRGELGRAPARATLRARALDLGFLPAVAPGVIRAASGKLEADLSAAGPLRRMLPRGSASLEDGAVAVAELGDFTGVALQASVNEDGFRLERLAARRGNGKVELKGEAKGLARHDAPAEVTAALTASDFPLALAGQELATVSTEASLQGTITAQALDAQLRIPRTLVRLPDKLPTRKIQPLDRRPDIVVAPFDRKARPKQVAAGPPFAAKVHLLVPSRFQIKGDNPRVDVELRADVVADARQGRLDLTGTVETLRGQVEPIGGRIFDIKRARVQFTGEDYQAGILDAQAVYANPDATVTVVLGGTLAKPDVKLTSQPPMDESQIAMLIATGRLGNKPGAGGVESNMMQEAGSAALGFVTQRAFSDLIADKLPVDSVSLEASQLRAGKYLTDKIYVGYTRRWNVQQEGENSNEVRVEYQISRRWTFESRYGDAQTGGASLIWSKDY